MAQEQLEECQEMQLISTAEATTSVWHRHNDLT